MLADTFQIDADNEGRRLDCALRDHLSGFSLRACRRLLKEGLVEYDGKQGRASQKVRAGAKVRIFPLEKKQDGGAGALLEIREPYFFLFKPPGLHTVSLAGGVGRSLEDDLPALLSVVGVAARPGRLLQRLDFGTAGIVCGSFTEKGAEFFRKAENEGKCEKFYLALLSGRLEKEIRVDVPLGTSGGKAVKTGGRAGAPWRETLFTPLDIAENVLREYFHLEEGVAASLALCRIKKGQRHQIRAHAQYAGFPLYGDSLYGGAGKNYFLWHYLLKFPGWAVMKTPENFAALKCPSLPGLE